MDFDKDLSQMYYKRDIDMNITNMNEIFAKAMNKLGYSPEAIERNLLNKYEFYCINLIRQDRKNNFTTTSERVSYEDFEQSNVPSISFNKKRFNDLSKYKNDHEEFYNHLDRSELTHLGY